MTKSKAKILVVDDNAGIRSALGILLPLHFSQVEIIPSPNELISRVGTFGPDAVLLDMNFHRDINTGNEGLYWLSELKSRYPDVQVVLFTAYADIALAVEGMKRGAADFIVKPWDNDKLINILENACEKAGRHGSAANRPQESKADAPMLWGTGTAMSEIRKTVGKIAMTDASVLITGENGTGKDVLAREIHRLSGRSGMPMINVDLGAVPETLFESELFGHAKGAFTDAKTDFAGKFEQAQGGTLFLDEIGNIPLHLQSKLLRVLQNRTVTRVGDTRSIPVNIRLVCATNMDLPQMVRDGKFREDLFYRINTVQIHLPPLRERKDEIPRLSEMFLEKFSGQYNRKVSSISDDALRVLVSVPWKGNIRELQNCIEKAVIMSEGETLTANDIMSSGTGPDLHAGPGDCNTPTAAVRDGNGEDTLEMIEEKAIRSAMKKYNGNLSMVAKALDISRPTLYSKLRKYNI
ncbi:MAG: sigma-54-dependent Fis family transcriptional regulator [Bacteroidetes bacterium]|uniref:Sigma-54-dependent Fis family transcriptional regulator n=1 Tax=Candidatus Cryptobacteroides avicola TaxID=2840757 RepID=A0A940DS54_9BACT|nr:sigma-54-dependent Fis family transcriptional regulator [Candidatus Cryptobacteroides avicola]